MHTVSEVKISNLFQFIFRIYSRSLGFFDFSLNFVHKSRTSLNSRNLTRAQNWRRNQHEVLPSQAWKLCQHRCHTLTDNTCWKYKRHSCEPTESAEFNLVQRDLYTRENNKALHDKHSAMLIMQLDKTRCDSWCIPRKIWKLKNKQVPLFILTLGKGQRKKFRRQAVRSLQLNVLYTNGIWHTEAWYFSFVYWSKKHVKITV